MQVERRKAQMRVRGGPAVIGPEVRSRMADVLDSVRSGEFAKALRDDARAGYPRLKAARDAARSEGIEQVYLRLKNVLAD